MSLRGLSERVPQIWWRRVVIAFPYLWLLVFFFAPFLTVVRLSLSYPADAIPPYLPILQLEDGIGGLWRYLDELTFENFRRMFDGNDPYYDPLNLVAYLSSLRIAFFSTLMVLLIAYPIAYAMTKLPREYQPLMMILVIIPFFSSLLIRVFAWIQILQPQGLFNLALSWVGIVDVVTQTDGVTRFANPVQTLDTELAVYIGIVYSYLPFMILPLYATLERIDGLLLEASYDLGCTRVSAFWRVTVPLSWPGVAAGCFLVFIPAIGEYVVPELLGGAQTLMIGRQLYNEFHLNHDWPFAAAFATLLLLVLLIPIVLYQRYQSRSIEAVR